MLTGKNGLTGKKISTDRPLPPDTRKGRGSFAKAVGSFVPKIATKAFEKYGFHTAEIMTQWSRIAGPEFATFTKPERMRWPRVPSSATAAGVEQRPGATLHLLVEPARALDAEYQAQEIIERINGYFGYRAVETLRLIQSPIGHRQQPPPNDPAARQPNLAEAPLVEAPMPPIADEPLKAALKALWSSVSATAARR